MSSLCQVDLGLIFISQLFTVIPFHWILLEEFPSEEGPIPLRFEQSLKFVGYRTSRSKFLCEFRSGCSKRILHSNILIFGVAAPPSAPAADGKGYPAV